jgi:hypothetical protein
VALARPPQTSMLAPARNLDAFDNLVGAGEQ